MKSDELFFVPTCLKFLLWYSKKENSLMKEKNSIVFTDKLPFLVYHYQFFTFYDKYFLYFCPFRPHTKYHKDTLFYFLIYKAF